MTTILPNGDSAPLSNVMLNEVEAGRKARSGFTLVELLVVMAIIAVMIALGLNIFKGGNLNLTTSVSQVDNMVSGARQLAISQNTKTRFIIVADDPSNPEEWRLHRYSVLREPENYVETSGTSSFVQFSPPRDLGSGVFFRKNIHTTNDTVKATNQTSMFDSLDTIKISGKDVKYAYIEFQPNGGTTGPSTQNIFEIEQAPAASVEIKNNMNYIRIGVAQYTGRVKFERPGVASTK